MPAAIALATGMPAAIDPEQRNETVAEIEDGIETAAAHPDGKPE